MSNINVSSGVVSSGLTISGGDSLTVLSGGTAVSTTLENGGELYVDGTANGTTLGNGGIEYVSAGSTSATVVENGGNENIYGGTVLATAVENGGNETVNAGVVSNTTVAAGGTTTIYGGSVVGVTLNGGSEEMQGGTALGTIVNNGGMEVIFAGTVTSSTVQDGGTETVYAGATVQDTVLLAGGVIDRTDFAFASGASATLDAGTDTLTVHEGGSSYTLSLAGNYAGASFLATSDGNGGTLITVESPACYARGTLIRTTRGEVAVEHLQPGDIAVTRQHGGDLPMRVIWIGQRRVDITGHPNPEHVRPIRFAPGSLGSGVPSRVLLVSPDHALLLDGLLVAARQLVNGATITIEFVASVQYFHVELERHGILLANGAPAESYLDTGNRSQFENAGTVVILHPDFRPREHPGACAPLVHPGTCAPLVHDATLVQPVWRRLAARAVALGHRKTRSATTRDSVLRLVLGADGTVLAPARISADGRHVFMLPEPAGSSSAVMLVSRHNAVADLRPWEDDRRQLGVAVAGIDLWMQARPQALPLRSARLGSGWWEIETSGQKAWRWTDGQGVLELPAGCVRLDILVAATAEYHQAESPEIAPRPRLQLA